ncbi:M23 family metallopeptidase [Patescibacteria group bacterium]|nr:M23 family metallopeptidase [Patescibacteria group bacterium]
MKFFYGLLILLITILIVGLVVYLIIIPESVENLTDSATSDTDSGTDIGSNEKVKLNVSAEKAAESISSDSNSLIYPPPISDAENRITKKPFGIKISLTNSPVQPEKFSGYHTGTDFEIRENELNREVMINAICTGEIAKRQHVTGYGGVIVQECLINEEEVRVIYGHLSLDKEIAQSGDNLTAGKGLAVLAEQGSVDAGGERKHLHLGIYRGDIVDWRGYVPTEKELEQWVDPESILYLK